MSRLSFAFPNNASASLGDGFRGQRLRKGPLDKFKENIVIFFTTDGESQGRQPLPAASSGVTAIIRRVRQKYQRQDMSFQIGFTVRTSSRCRFRAA